MKALDFSLEPIENARLAELCGPLDENLRQIATALDLRITRRNAHFYLEAATNHAENKKRLQQAKAALQHFYQLAEKPLSIDDIQLGLIETIRLSTDQPISPTDSLISGPQLLTRKGNVHGRTPRQVAYLNAIQSHDITFGVGPAGTGKTYLAVAMAIDAFERELVERIILTRPAVEAGERLGFLPGDLSQKIDPYLRPLYDALYDLMGADRVAKLHEKNAIEIAPLAFMRGRTLNHAFIILDEAQNTTPEQMKMFLTRIGIGAKAVVTGDITQIDLPRGQQSGLKEAIALLQAVQGLAFIHFLQEDVVRHPLVARIVNAYEKQKI